MSRTAVRTHRSATPLEAEDLVFAGSLCTAGEAVAVVYATGMATQIGRIAALTQQVRSDMSPLQRQVGRARTADRDHGGGAGGTGFVAIGIFVAG